MQLATVTASSASERRHLSTSQCSHEEHAKRLKESLQDVVGAAIKEATYKAAKQASLGSRSKASPYG